MRLQFYFSSSAIGSFYHIDVVLVPFILISNFILVNLLSVSLIFQSVSHPHSIIECQEGKGKKPLFWLELVMYSHSHTHYNIQKVTLDIRVGTKKRSLVFISAQVSHIALKQYVRSSFFCLLCDVELLLTYFIYSLRDTQCYLKASFGHISISVGMNVIPQSKKYSPLSKQEKKLLFS